MQEQWIRYIEQEYGMTLEEFNKLDYRTRYEIWEEFINEEDSAN